MIARMWAILKICSKECVIFKILSIKYICQWRLRSGTQIIETVDNYSDQKVPEIF